MKVGAALVSLLLLLPGLARAEEAEPPAIIGGEGAVVGQFPTVVGLTIGQGLCTGTLITPQWVLTAAHCLEPTVVQLPDQATVTARTTVHFDTVDLRRPGGRTVAAALTLPKPEFDPRRLGQHDIGLIKLAEPVTDRRPTPVNLTADLAQIGILVTQVGFGATMQGPAGTFGVANVLEGRRSTACASYGASDANLLCFAQTDNMGKCQGDSGGPSFAAINGVTTQVGVTSFGDMTCAQLGADTRTDAEVAWLLEQIPELNALCESDADCDDGRTCFLGRCIVAPFAPTGVGAECATNDDCESGVCGEGPGGSLCTFVCSPADNSGCPEGFECRGANGAAGACWPLEDDGGCCSTTGAGTPPLLLTGLLALVLGRRRRR